jgi:glyoxylase-like metal-dependent hydrolase (beta-lactamase superfamily II)
MNEPSSEQIVRISLPTPFPVAMVNVFLIKRDPLTLVDTGTRTEDSYEKLVAKLAEQGVAVKDLQVILITHGHLDHMGLLGRLLEESNAQVYAHPHVVERAKKYDEAHDENVTFYVQSLREFGAPESDVEQFLTFQEEHAPYGAPAQIQNGVQDGDRVGPYTVYHVPGHSPSDVLFVDVAQRLAFTGDHVLKGITPNPVLRRPREGEERPRSLIEYLDSLRKTHSLDLAVCYPGHGSPIYDHRAIIDDLFRRTDARTARVLDALGEQALTPYEVCMSLFPKIDSKQLMLGLSVAIGHLELLEQEGTVVSSRRDGIVRFQRSAG